MMPEEKDGGSDFKSEMVELRQSMASNGVETGKRVRVSTVSMGSLGSPWQPFMDKDDEHNWYCFCSSKSHVQNLLCVSEKEQLNRKRIKECLTWGNGNATEDEMQNLGVVIGSKWSWNFAMHFPDDRVE